MSSRRFEHGQRSYRSEHVSHPGQQTRHILADALLQHYGASVPNYSAWSSSNYRMGPGATNRRDTNLDRHIIGETFYHEGRKDGYDASVLARGTAHTAGLSRQQQLDGIGARFDRAKEAYQATGEYKYFMMQKDLRGIAEQHLDADLRGFRLSSRK